MNSKCYCGDCREIMKNLADAGQRVQMCVTSPPYWGLRDYGTDGQIGLESTIDEYIENMVGVFRHVRELLADDGTLWVNMGDGYTSGGRASWRSGISNNKGHQCLDDAGHRPGTPLGLKPKDLIGQPWRLAFALQADGWYLRQDIIWHKPNPMPESVLDRCTKAHEYIFLLSKSERYYFDQEAIKEPASPNTNPRVPGNKSHKGLTAYENGDEFSRTKAGLVKYSERQKANRIKNNLSMDAALAVMPETRNKRSVWSVPSEPFSGAHFATFPTKLIEPCILAGSCLGDVVLDPFFGSGTTGQVCESLGRKWLGCELYPEYFALQKDRIRQMGLSLC